MMTTPRPRGGRRSARNLPVTRPVRPRQPWGRRPTEPANPRRKLGYLIVVLAVVGFWQVNRQEPVVFEFDRTSLVSIWNAAASTAPELSVASLDWTDVEQRTFGFAWSPTLSVIGRTEADSEKVVELVVVGEPASDGRDRIVTAMDILVAVTEPDLTAMERRRVLADLSLVDDASVALPVGSVTTSKATYRVAANPELGRLGLGAAPRAGR